MEKAKIWLAWPVMRDFASIFFLPSSKAGIDSIHHKIRDLNHHKQIPEPNLPIQIKFTKYKIYLDVSTRQFFFILPPKGFCDMAPVTTSNISIEPCPAILHGSLYSKENNVPLQSHRKKLAMLLYVAALL